VASALLKPSYRGMVGVPQGVFHVVARRPSAVASHRFLHVRSAQIEIRVVGLYLCWWPPSRRRRGLRLGCRWRLACDTPAFSTRWVRNSWISISLS
jgi:hypothetical protein